jgi:hypothetical protein
MPATSLRQWLGTAAEPIVIDLISDDEEEAFNMVRTQRSLKAGSSTPSFAQAPAPARKASAPGTATIAIPTAQFITGARRAAAHALSSAPVSSSSSYIPSSRLSLRASTRPVTPAIPAMPATPATAPPTPGPSTTRTRKRQRIVTTLGPFAPAPVPGPEGVTLNDMLAESHRRLHPGGIVCPLRIGDEDCEAILATPQILLMVGGE